MAHSDLDRAAIHLLLHDQQEAVDLSSDNPFEGYPDLKKKYVELVETAPGTPEAMVAMRAIAMIDLTLCGTPLPDLGPEREGHVGAD